MRWTAILVACGVALSAGCRLAHDAARNVWNEPLEYLDEKRVTERLRDEAEDVLKELCGKHGRVFADDFRDGFIDGYADFLERGGNTAPPAVPPLKYRRGRFLNPDGHARVHDYFAGFKMGADTAAQTGKRQFLTVPVLVPEPLPDVPANARQMPTDQCAPAKPAAPPPPPSREQLPTARPTDAGTGLPAPNRPLAHQPPAPVLPPLPTVPVTDPPKATAADPVAVPEAPRAADDKPTEVRPVLIDRPAADLADPPGRTVVPPLPDLPRGRGGAD